MNDEESFNGSCSSASSSSSNDCGENETIYLEYPKVGYTFDPKMMEHHEIPDPHIIELKRIYRQQISGNEDGSDSDFEEHPEQPLRIQAIYENLLNLGLIQPMDGVCFDERSDLGKFIPGRMAEPEELALVHDSAYLDQVETWKFNEAIDKEPEESGDDDDIHKQQRSMHQKRLDAISRQLDSVYLCPATPESASFAAGSTVELVRAVHSGFLDHGMAIVRPPGHHAEPDHAMGFCIYNNVALAARVLLKDQPDLRIVILDWDVHHGNGTMRMVQDDERILFISIHRYDAGRFYPVGTVEASPSYKGPHETIVNVAWPTGGFGDGDYWYAMTRLILPLTFEFAPNIILVSAGFDAARDDPIGGCDLTPNGYGQMTRALSQVAPTVLVLEGGYNVPIIADCAASCFGALLGRGYNFADFEHQSWQPCQAAVEVVEQAVRLHSDKWRSLYPKVSKPPPHAIAFEALISEYWSRVICQDQLGMTRVDVAMDPFIVHRRSLLQKRDLSSSLPKLVIIFHQIESTADDEHVNRSSFFAPNLVTKLIERLPNTIGILDIAFQDGNLTGFDDKLWNEIVSNQFAQFSVDVITLGTAAVNSAVTALFEKERITLTKGRIIIFSPSLLLPLIEESWYSSVLSEHEMNSLIIYNRIPWFGYLPQGIRPEFRSPRLPPLDLAGLVAVMNGHLGLIICSRNLKFLKLLYGTFY